MSEVSHLIIVPCHAIWLGGNSVGGDSSEWILKPFQKDEMSTYKAHIQKGMDILAQNKTSLLVFSGGRTSPASTSSEAASYLQLGLAMNPGLSQERLLVESYARDSFENVVFSICRFYEHAASYPERVTVVGHDFKRRRFVQLYAPLIGFPADAFQYIGIDPPDIVEATIGESRNYDQLLKDPFSSCDPLLVSKREERNPHNDHHSYKVSNPICKPLMEWKGPEAYAGELPWRPL